MNKNFRKKIIIASQTYVHEDAVFMQINECVGTIIKIK